MAVNSETRTIGENQYRVTQLGAKKARGLFVRLVKALGPAFAAMVGGGNVKALLGKDVSSLAPMLLELTERISEDEVNYFSDVLAGCTELIGSNGNTAKLADVYDIHFSGHILEMFTWMAFALEVQFSDFLSAWKRTQAAAIKAPVVAPSTSLIPSIGTSGAS